MTVALYNQLKLICLQRQKRDIKFDKRILLVLIYMNIIQNLLVNYNEISYTDTQRSNNIYQYLNNIIQ